MPETMRRRARRKTAGGVLNALRGLFQPRTLDGVARIAPKGGNVPVAEKARRRAANRRARASRKANRR
jgi:hypothetical protein